MNTFSVTCHNAMQITLKHEKTEIEVTYKQTASQSTMRFKTDNGKEYI